MSLYLRRRLSRGFYSPNPLNRVTFGFFPKEETSFIVPRKFYLDSLKISNQPFSIMTRTKLTFNQDLVAKPSRRFVLFRPSCEVTLEEKLTLIVGFTNLNLSLNKVRIVLTLDTEG